MVGPPVLAEIEVECADMLDIDPIAYFERGLARRLIVAQSDRPG
jgi:hypothetical protein